MEAQGLRIMVLFSKYFSNIHQISLLNPCNVINAQNKGVKKHNLCPTNIISSVQRKVILLVLVSCNQNNKIFCGLVVKWPPWTHVLNTWFLDGVTVWEYVVHRWALFGNIVKLLGSRTSWDKAAHCGWAWSVRTQSHFAVALCFLMVDGMWLASLWLLPTELPVCWPVSPWTASQNEGFLL